MAVTQYVYRISSDDSSSYTLPARAYPTSIQLGSNIVSRSWNNYKGQFQDVLINHKLKFSWVFDVISTADLEAMMSYIFSKIEDTSSPTRFFTLNGYFVGRGWLETKVYLGTPTNISSIGPNQYHKYGLPGWWKCELHWIEVDGKVLLASEQSNNAETQENQLNNRRIILNNKKIEIANSGDISNILNEAS